MKKYFNRIVLSMMCFGANAAEPNLDLLRANLNTEVEIIAVKPSAIAGLYEVQLNSDIVYLSEDGEKIISGDLYDLRNGISHTDQAKNHLRQSVLATVKDSDKIIYKAKNEKYKVAVFTDISCPYCTKFHQHINEFNDLGITIEYLAFPRAGVGSKHQQAMQNIWCASNKTQALTDAKMKQKIPTQTCADNQVNEQFLLGQEIGINATPTVVFSDGELVPGYLKPANLLEILEDKN